MPAVTLTGTMPHRLVTAEKPDRVVPLAPRMVDYLCGRCEITTTVRLHPQAPIPQLWPCRRCRASAECSQDADEDAELIGLPAASKLPPRKTHGEHVRDRRSDAELDRRRPTRRGLLRAGKLHSGPSPR